jgi:hypothetical protein
MQYLLNYTVFNRNFLIYHDFEIQHLLDNTFSNYNLQQFKTMLFHQNVVN